VRCKSERSTRDQMDMNIFGYVIGIRSAKDANLPADQINRFGLLGAVLPSTPVYLVVLLSLIRKAAEALPPPTKHE
jgi:hypothetical protein